MNILGIDLASQHYCDIGLALIDAGSAPRSVQWVRPPAHGLSDPPDATALGEFVGKLARNRDVTIIAVDGPAAWKAPDNGLLHSRVCERQLNTQAKTGLPGFAKPASALRFVSFAVEFFDALAAQGWPRSAQAADKPIELPLTIEVWPTAAWRALGLRPLPSKAATRPTDVADWLRQLQTVFPMQLTEPPTHDELQAVVAALVGEALARGRADQVAFYGQPPFILDGAWREGYIVNFRGR